MNETMSEVNRMTPAKEARLRASFTDAANEAPLDIHVRQISPVLDMTVQFATELAAYKLAYYFRDHSTSYVRVLNGQQGQYLVVLSDRATR